MPGRFRNDMQMNATDNNKKNAENDVISQRKISETLFNFKKDQNGTGLDVRIQPLLTVEGISLPIQSLKMTLEIKCREQQKLQSVYLSPHPMQTVVLLLCTV